MVVAAIAEQSIGVMTALAGLIGAGIAVYRLWRPSASSQDDRDEHIDDLRDSLRDCRDTVQILRDRLNVATQTSVQRSQQ